MRDEVRHPWREAMRSLWFLPTVFILAALASGSWLSQIQIPRGGALDSLMFRGSAAAARELLIVVSGTMITVTGLVFVLTVVALQIASTQFSPRLLRSFLQDPGTRLVLSVFVATFSYSLGGLFTVGHTTDAGTPFVPRVAVTGSLLLALLSVGMLVYYIQHITNSIRIDTVMLGVRRATTRAIHDQFPHPARAEEPRLARPAPPEDAVVVPATRSGYVQEVLVDEIEAFARTSGLAVRLRPQVGQHVVAGTPIAWVWRRDGTAARSTDGVSALNRAVVRAHERHVENDVGFGVRQLVDIGLRAVAPSINDPYTAVQAVQHLSVVIAELAGVATDDVRRADQDGLLVFVPVPGFELLLDVVCTNLRRNSSRRSRVMIELLRLLETAAVMALSEGRRAEIARQVEVVLADTEREVLADGDLVLVRSQARRAQEAADTGVMSRDP